MQKVLSADIWSEIGKRARSADTRKAAIAYFTMDLVGFRADDVLVVDASRNAIGSGQTDARLLQKLNQAGVRLYNQEWLHAKVLLLDGYSIIGSANMSASSPHLIEAAVISDNATTASGVSSFIAQLATPPNRLDSTRIATPLQGVIICRGREREAYKQ
jgi:phosphatidylserine/phosphatidylglycerophosphate/cardiolipin synthase-like enzyme